MPCRGEVDLVDRAGPGGESRRGLLHPRPAFTRVSRRSQGREAFLQLGPTDKVTKVALAAEGDEIELEPDPSLRSRTRRRVRRRGDRAVAQVMHAGTVLRTSAVVGKVPSPMISTARSGSPSMARWAWRPKFQARAFQCRPVTDGARHHP